MTSSNKDPRNETGVDLGFLEAIGTLDEWQLESRFFPSKLGGKPSWLNLKDLPPTSQIECPTCNTPRSFLCQIYANIDDFTACFHRTLFVFMCRTVSCHQKSLRNVNDAFLVLRCQLPRDNPYYPYDPPPRNLTEQKVWRTDLTVNKFSEVCRACGSSAAGSRGGKCAGCGKVRYCHPKHQRIDWKARHKKECKNSEGIPTSLDNVTLDSIIFPTWEIVMESEEYMLNSEDSSDEETSDNEKHREDIETMQTLNEKSNGLSAEEISKYMGNDMKLDKLYKKFQKTTKLSPDQVIRYQRFGDPLWISIKDRPNSNDIPVCEQCGATRKFEFQIMPQLLNSLNLDVVKEGDVSIESIDWGVLAVFTCSRSCDNGLSYKPEFLWKQEVESLQETT